MAAYVFLTVEITDADAHGVYRERAPAVVEAYGGRLLARGDVVESSEGELTTRRRMLAMEFPTVQQARDWLDLKDGTPEQAEVRELRGKMGNMISINVVDGNL